MTGKVRKKREELRAKLLMIAEDRISQDGIDAIRARDLASEAGCAVGAIYNVFGDLRDLIMAVNSRTFERLRTGLEEEIRALGTTDPLEIIVAMGHGYLKFAAENTPAWKTLFDLQRAAEKEVPKWYQEDLNLIFKEIARPIKKLNPTLDDTETLLLTRALFSAVHGIVTLGLENRISAVPSEDLQKIIAFTIRKMVVSSPEIVAE